ncbi:hypothetical protein TSOC_006403 [Tetrabaena socialis]|uniref:Uncharacterized protein n=1 Tax=Tetrabaena socialis TaxID=47790 RepID=A0A2J8A3R6_9CHLO|nr:hypothetical protein TSOC_006403 [Tetrabaena socialis]|eukprot:PNH07154.1 hypothetical protein TSOC_006403 [Tetrabaena socialis]
MQSAADTLLAKARERYEAGDRMTAMKYYEEVLKEITIQLRKFSQQVQNAMANRAPAERPYGKGKAASSGRRPAAGQDLDSILGSATSDEAQVDTSVPAIIRRVAILLLVGSGLGVALWFLGLEVLFPKGI